MAEPKACLEPCGHDRRFVVQNPVPNGWKLIDGETVLQDAILVGLLRCSLSKVILQDVPLAQIVVEWDGEAAGALNAMNLHHDHSAEGVVLHKLCTKFLEQTIVLLFQQVPRQALGGPIEPKDHWIAFEGHEHHRDAPILHAVRNGLRSTPGEIQIGHGAGGQHRKGALHIAFGRDVHVPSIGRTGHKEELLLQQPRNVLL
mmetsp:Transcript_31234/g.67364  ORF Transcript_31234/g.67364 Transcript_31234/m.67364 type:complete len:201 (+) Transcript_31234:202-804(+)